MDRPMTNSHFNFMSLGYTFRDFFFPRKNVLREVKIKSGFCLLDYGCGSGSYSIIAAEIVGKEGKVYALDIHPLAVKMVQKKASKKSLTNIETVLSESETGLEDKSVDVVLLYDVFHELSEPDVVLKELNRVLKPGGILSFSDHHLEEKEIISKVQEGGFFGFSNKGKKTYSFFKVK
jgi:ubiquinone/menaquinone biosynthesis C-methylase UbiE